MKVAFFYDKNEYHRKAERKKSCPGWHCGQLSFGDFLWFFWNLSYHLKRGFFPLTVSFCLYFRGPPNPCKRFCLDHLYCWRKGFHFSIYSTYLYDSHHDVRILDYPSFEHLEENME
jgi:hypothetical protein